MSTGNRVDIKEKKKPELRVILGQGDTPRLMAQPFQCDFDHDIAYAGGVSVDRRRVYVDKWLYRQIMSGELKIRGLGAQQVVERIIDHEHTEKAVEDGDNDADTYQPAHAYALAQEHDGVGDILGPGRTELYENDLKRALKECRLRFMRLNREADPPRDLWCGPYLDRPTASDKKILEIMRAKGVADAFKLSKYDVHYGRGGEECRRCIMFGGQGAKKNKEIDSSSSPLQLCDVVCGLVRANRWCDRWEPRT